MMLEAIDIARTAIDIARTAEAATSQLADIRNPEPLSTRINALTNSVNNRKYQIHSEICGNCGTKHDQTKSPFVQHSIPNIGNVANYVIGRGFSALMK